MEYIEPPWGYRENDPSLYDQQSTKPGITPDLVSPAIEGYFHLPALWIDKDPTREEGKTPIADAHREVVISRSLQSNIRVRVQRDGMFLFDFANWPLAPITTIPGYTIPGTGSHRPAKQHVAAEKIAEERAALRAQLMNTHQACLGTAHWLLKRSGHPLGFPVRPGGTHKALTFTTPVAHHYHPHDPRAIAVNYITKSLEAEDSPRRRIISSVVIQKSFDLLDEILKNNDPLLLHICDTAYMSARLKAERRGGESISTGWTVCEQLISMAWRGLIEKLDQNGTPRINRDRRKKLSGRDYTASIIVEMLEINGIINEELYEHLERARKARNAWSHSVKSPSENDLYRCQKAIELLMAQVLGINWNIHASAGGSVVQWPIWMWRQWKGQ